MVINVGAQGLDGAKKQLCYPFVLLLFGTAQGIHLIAVQMIPRTS